MDKHNITLLLTQTGNNTLHNPHKVNTETHYFEVCTVHLVHFIIHTNNILYNVSTPTCSNASASIFNGVLHFAKITKIIRVIKLNKNQ
jgi:hypothetical protein